MPDAIDYAIRQVTNNIPEDLLNLTFPEPADGFPWPMREQIVTKVIQEIVLPDCSLFGGRPKHISLLPEYFVGSYASGAYSIVGTTSAYSLHRIPPEARDNLDMLTVAGVLPTTVGSRFGDVAGFGGVSPAMLGNRALQSISYTGVPSPPVAEICGNDLISMRPSVQYMPSWTVVVNLAYDDRLTNLNTAAIDPFGALVVLATQRYIYNKFALKLDVSPIQFGGELGAVRGVIESYGSAIETYRTALARFCAMSKYDSDRLLRILQYQIP